MFSEKNIGCKPNLHLVYGSELHFNESNLNSAYKESLFKYSVPYDRRNVAQGQKMTPLGWKMMP